MISKKINISLDSTVFRDIDFIEWLQMESAKFDIYLSVIVYLETYHWYNMRKINKSLFDKEITALQCTILNLNESEVKTISSNVLISKLPFKHHIRDIIIGTHSQDKSSILITDNKKHFQWMKKKPMNPDELIQYVSK